MAPELARAMRAEHCKPRKPDGVLPFSGGLWAQHSSTLGQGSRWEDATGTTATEWHRETKPDCQLAVQITLYMLTMTC